MRCWRLSHVSTVQVLNLFERTWLEMTLLFIYYPPLCCVGVGWHVVKGCHVVVRWVDKWWGWGANVEMYLLDMLWWVSWHVMVQWVDTLWLLTRRVAGWHIIVGWVDTLSCGWLTRCGGLTHYGVVVDTLWWLTRCCVVCWHVEVWLVDTLMWSGLTYCGVVSWYAMVSLVDSLL